MPVAPQRLFAALRTFLDASTVHITWADSELLSDGAAEGILVVREYEHGWWIYAPQDADDLKEACDQLRKAGFSPALVDLLKLAHKAEAAYIVLDADASEIKGLPDYRESWDAGMAALRREDAPDRYAVDVPDVQGDGGMVDVATFPTRKQAIDFARKRFGADALGRLQLVSKFNADHSDEPEPK